MHMLKTTLTLLALALVLIGCATIVNPVIIPDFSFQSSTCIKTYKLSKDIKSDSIFTWSFGKELDVTFSVQANCLPETNRFACSYTVSHDTVIITAADTARDVAMCDCHYLIQATIRELTMDSCYVRCRSTHPGLNRDPIHLVRVFRSS
jgi:hypothetical protein